MGLKQEIPMLMRYAALMNDTLVHNRKLFEINEGDLLKYVLEDLQRQLSTKSFEQAKHRVSPINILKKLVDKLSKIYADAPSRTTSGSDSDMELVQFYCDGFKVDQTMGLANKYFNLYKNTAIEVFLDGTTPRLRVVPSDRFLVYGADPVDPLKVTHYMKLMGKKSVTKGEGTVDVNVWYIYTDNEFIAVTEEQVIVTEVMEALDNKEGINPFGKIPMVYINRSMSEIQPRPDSDLLAMVRLLPVLFTDLNFAVMFQTFSIIYGIDVDPSNMEMSPNAFWSLKSETGSGKEPKIGTIRPEADIPKVLEFISQQFTMWLETRNIRTGSLGSLRHENLASGISKVIDQMDTTEDKKEQIQFFNNAEMDLWELVTEYVHPVWSKVKGFEKVEQFTKEVDVLTEFAEPKMESPQNVVIDSQIKMIGASLTTQVRAIMEIHDLDEQEAQDLADEINSSKVLVIAQNQAAQELEAPGEPVKGNTNSPSANDNKSSASNPVVVPVEQAPSAKGGA